MTDQMMDQMMDQDQVLVCSVSLYCYYWPLLRWASLQLCNQLLTAIIIFKVCCIIII